MRGIMDAESGCDEFISIGEYRSLMMKSKRRRRPRGA
jgi:hypothetical protein